MLSSNQNIRLGFLALASGMISQSDLFEAIAEWREGRNPLLGEVLLNKELIDKASLQSLVQLVKREEENADDASVTNALLRLPSGRDLAHSYEDPGEKDPGRTLSFGGNFSTLGSKNGNDTSASSAPIDHRFLNLRIHAKGGLGEIWLAEDLALKRQVALKQIRNEHADLTDSRTRFVQEAEITGRLEHPGIVPIYAFGEYADGRPYYAMRFIRGQCLEHEIKRYHQDRLANAHGKKNDIEAPTLRQLLARFIDVCEAIAYAHSRGVLHRDLKPENIMLGLYGETLVVDWGLAKAEGQQTPTPHLTPDETRIELNSGTPTRLGSTLGTPGYMSPEQALGEIDKLSPATDIYSLGATLFCLLTGRAPIKGKRITDIIEDTCWGKFPAPRSLVSDIPRPLESICVKALSLKPDDRYDTALELATDVQHFLDEEPVGAHKDSLSEKLSRWMRQHKSAAVASAATMSIIVVASLASSVMIAKSRNVALRLADENAQLAIKERQSRETAEQLQQKTEKYYALAVSSVDRFLTNVADDDRLKAFGLENLRRDLLAQARDFYELVIEQSEEMEDPLHAERANTNQRLAALHFEVGDYAKAIDSYNKALEQVTALHNDDQVEISDSIILLNDMSLALDAAGRTSQAIKNWRVLLGKISSLVQTQPENPTYHGLLATVKLNLANKLELRTPTESIALSKEATQHASRAIELQPAESDYRDTLALIHNNLAKTYIQQERFIEGRKELEIANSIWQELAAKSEGWVADFYANRLALAHLNQAAIAAQSGEASDAVERLEQALDIRQRIAALHPDSVQPQILLAQVHLSAAKHFRTLSRYKKSQQQSAAALKIYRHLYGQHPATPDYRRDTAIAMIEQGLTQLAMGNRLEASSSMQEAIDITTILAKEVQPRSDYRRPRAISRYYLGLVLSDSAEPEQAANQLRLAAEEMSDLCATLDEDVELFAHLADCQTSLAALLGPELLDNKLESQKWWSAALATCDRLLGEEFSSRIPPSARVKVQMRRAEALTGTKQYDLALAAWEQLFASSPGELNYEFTSGKATTLFRAGRYGESLQLMNETALRIKHPPLVYAIARQLSLNVRVLSTTNLPTGERAKWMDSYGTTAVQLLQKAEEMGYFANKQTMIFMKDDDYLTPLKDRADFQSFLDNIGQ